MQISLFVAQYSKYTSTSIEIYSRLFSCDSLDSVAFHYKKILDNCSYTSVAITTDCAQTTFRVASSKIKRKHGDWNPFCELFFSRAFQVKWSMLHVIRKGLLLKSFPTTTSYLLCRWAVVLAPVAKQPLLFSLCSGFAHSQPDMLFWKALLDCFKRKPKTLRRCQQRLSRASCCWYVSAVQLSIFEPVDNNSRFIGKFCSTK